jgi:hypothetical protein
VAKLTKRCQRPPADCQRPGRKSIEVVALWAGVISKGKPVRTVLFISAIFGPAAFSGPVFADSLGGPCTDRPESEYLSLEALKAKVVGHGYQIRSGEIRKACGEFYALDMSGKRAELFVDPTNGKIVAGAGKGETGVSGDDKDRSGVDDDGDE